MPGRVPRRGHRHRAAGHRPPGDYVLSVTRSGGQLVVSYLPASRFWTEQLIQGGLYLAVAAIALARPSGCCTGALPERGKPGARPRITCS